MQRWTIGVLAVLVGAACSRGESLGIEEVPERVLELQDLLETEGITTSNETRFLPNPHSSEDHIRAAAAANGLDAWETDLLLARMKENWDRKVVPGAGPDGGPAAGGEAGADPVPRGGGRSGGGGGAGARGNEPL